MQILSSPKHAEKPHDPHTRRYSRSDCLCDVPDRRMDWIASMTEKWTTTGPWEATKGTDETPWHVKVTFINTAKQRCTGFIAQAIYGRSDEEAEANAHLISASPDLAAELHGIHEELVMFLQSGTSPSQDWITDNVESIDAVLSRARGES